MTHFIGCMTSLWNETIDDLEVDESDNETWSLADISQDGDTFSLPTSPPSWLSVSGTDLVATNAPAVTADQEQRCDGSCDA